MHRNPTNKSGRGVFLQILSNLVMEKLLSELRDLISPRLKGKLHERQKSWMLVRTCSISIFFLLVIR